MHKCDKICSFLCEICHIYTFAEKTLNEKHVLYSVFSLYKQGKEKDFPKTFLLTHSSSNNNLVLQTEHRQYV